ncbi:uncharacterized protein LOC129960026 [Argiope bruennichi]|uniref:uncharacterized protein LOC129960026 n=1 Tax=Argiope bruennichi TaxID=94029 RepID=UPI0024954488|nr:uncharacterized protein LOC129960026 [Argiope bruennichi]XP_055929011.1 uncharacterized protein LOC129960026 [Argiope bruennichi]
MTEKGEKNLLMNVSKDEMNTIDEILQSRQHGVVPERRIIRIPLLSRAFVSGSPKIHFPVRVLIRTGPLRQLTNVQRPSKPVVDTVPSDDESDVDDTSSFEIPERLEDLILLEHNYAVKYSIPLKSKENENAVETKTQETCDIKEVSESSSILEVPEISSILEVRAISGSSEVPAVSGNSDVPAVSGSSEVPAVSGSSEVPAASGSSEVPAASGSSEVPAVSGSSEVPAVSGSSEIPAVSGSSEIPAVSGSSKIPAVSGSSEIPAVSGSSEINAASGRSEIPATSGSSEVPAVSGSSEVPAASGSSEVPAASGSSEVPAASGSSEVPAVSGSSEIPAVSGSSEIPAVSGSSKIPAVSGSSEINAASGSSEIPATSGSSEVAAVSGSFPVDTATFSGGGVVGCTKEVSGSSKVPEISGISKVPETSSISPPIRRSKRQIEKLERELVSAAKVDALDNEVPKEKLVKHETTNKTDKDTINWNSDIKISNYKCFADFKKRHLKVVIEDCKKAKIENESVSTELSNTNREVKESAEILHDSIIIKSKNESTADEKNIENFKHPESQTRSKYLRKTKLHEPTDLESDDKSNAHGPHAKKKKYLNLIHKSIDSLKSPECEEKSEKSSTENVFKGEKTTEHSQQVNLTNLNKKRKKCILASEKLTNDADIHQIADSPVRKKKKRVSFSEYLLVSDETIPRKQQVVSSDRKESHRKLSVNSPAISITPISKVHKKKILRRDSLRLINDDGPALFSQPDVMIKVSADDNINKKDEKESDSSDRSGKVKATHLPAIKNSPKESHVMKNKKMLKDKSENNRLSLKTKQDKEAIKVLHEEKEKQASKLNQENKEESALTREDKGKPASTQEDKGKQALKQGDKEKQTLKEELKQGDKGKQTLKEELKQGDKEKQTLKELKQGDTKKQTLKELKQGDREKQEKRTVKESKQGDKEKQTVKELKQGYKEKQTVKELKQGDKEKQTVKELKQGDKEKQTVKELKQGEKEKRTVKELKHGDKEKQTLKELKQGGTEKRTVKELKHGDKEKQILKELKQGDKEKQTVKELKQGDKEKQSLNEELKQGDKEKQTLKEELKQGDKEKQTLKEELKQGDKEKQTLKEELKQGDEEKQTLKEELKQGDEEKQTLKEELKQGDEEKQTLKEELKQGDEEKQTLKEELKQGDEEKQTLKEELKQGDEEKQTLKEELKQVDEEKQTLKEELKQVDEEKQTLKEELKQGDKEKQTLKEELKQGDKEKQIVKEELKQGDKELKQDDKLDSKMQTEDGERQMLNQGEKERQILNEEAKERKVFKQDDSKMDLKKTEKQTLKSLEEEELTHKHLEEQCSEEYEEEKHVIRERHYEEKSDSNEENSFHQMHSLTLQDTEGELVINNEMQHSYSNFINIEALLESSKFHATVQEIEEHTSTDSKCINLPTTEVSDNKDHSEEALKHYNDDKLSETVSNTESDNRLSFFTGVNEESKSVPKRKSHRLIKKKEFFGDTSDSSESKKVFATKNKRIKLGKLNGRGRSIRRIKNGINKNDELNGSNDCPEEENSTDFFEEDDPKKLWCICRKPHNSRFMIQCDKCEDWFHGSCVGVTKQYGRQLEKQKKEWNCPNCCSKGEPSPQKVEKSLEQAVDIGNPNQKNLRIDEQDEDVTCENRKDPLLHDVNILNSTNSGNYKMSADDLKNLDSSASDQFPDGEASTNKGRVQFNIEEKLDKISKVRILKHSSQQKRSADFKQNSSTNLKTPDDSSKLSNSSMQSSALNMKSDISLKSSLLTKQTLSNSHNASPNKKTSVANRCSGKPASGFLNPRRKLSNTLKEKDHSVKKKQSCVNCQSEARANSCYCSDDCIEKYAALCLKTMRDAKGGLKGPEFDSQRLVVLDCLKGSLISNENGPTAGEIVSWLKSNPSFIIACSSSMSPSAKKDANSQKKETESNSNSEKTDATNQSAKPTVRLNVRKTLKNILLERVKKSDDLEMAEEDVQKIAVKIEEELNSLFKDNSFKYRAKYRSLMFNIKDPRNQGLFRKILKGNIPPDKLVRMTPEELASLELAKWREQENQHLLDMIKRVQLEQQKNGSVLFLKKTHKGEVEIEDDLTSILEQDLPKPVVKDSSNDLIDTEKEEMKDSTHLHRSHLFDNNCKICTGKIVPPSADENTPKKVRVAHSISVDLGSPNASEGPKVIDGKSPVSSAGDESMDEVPTSTVSESPEINEKSLKDTPSKTLSSVWKGFVHMQDVAKFLTIAYKVSGPTRHLQADLPDTMQICGRIIPDQVWDYLGKIKQSGSKELVIIRFQAANDEEAITYRSFYSYLSSRKRYGVVSNYSKKIKDFYLLPLASTSPVPMVLVPFDGPGLPSPRPHLLLGVIVRHKFKHPVLRPVVSKQRPSVKARVGKAGDSFTPPQEPRSYTPPLPTSSSLDEAKEQENKSVVSPDSANKDNFFPYDSTLKNADFTVDKPTTPLDKASISDASPFEKDDDKPYDPEQDIVNITSEPPKSQNAHFSLDVKKERSTVNLEQQKKLLDALSRQVEETENALKQLISHPRDDTVEKSPNAPCLDINSVAETGMSSFLDLPENLQELFNSARFKTSNKEKGDVDMRIKTLFGKHFDEHKNDGSRPPEILRSSNNSSKTLNNLEVYNLQAPTSPANDENMDKSTIASLPDPRIKIRTSSEDMSFISKDTFPSNVSLNIMSVPDVTDNPEKQLPVEMPKTELPLSEQKIKSIATMPPNVLLSGWNSGKEPPPPGIEPTETPSQESLSIQSSPHTSVPQIYVSTVQDTSQHVNSAFHPQAFSSFQPRLPLGFSIHTPPPIIKHFPPPPIVSTSFPLPPPLTMHVVPSQVTDSNLVKDQWPALQPPSHQTEGSEWDVGSSHWKVTSDHHGNQCEGDSRYYSSDRSNDYGNEDFYKRDVSARLWNRPQKFTYQRWGKKPSKGFTNQRRGKRGSSFKRNIRN